MPSEHLLGSARSLHCRDQHKWETGGERVGTGQTCRSCGRESSVGAQGVDELGNPGYRARTVAVAGNERVKLEVTAMQLSGINMEVFVGRATEALERCVL